MATLNSFEDLEVWQLARAYAKAVYLLTTQGALAKDFSLKNQMNESSGSIMDNIAEGFERDGNKEFITFLSYAKGSAGESRSQLYRAYDRQYIDEETFVRLKADVELISKKISGFIGYLKRSDYRGLKFSEPPTETWIPETYNLEHEI